MKKHLIDAIIFGLVIGTAPVIAQPAGRLSDSDRAYLKTVLAEHERFPFAARWESYKVSPEGLVGQYEAAGLTELIPDDQTGQMLRHLEDGTLLVADPDRIRLEITDLQLAGDPAYRVRRTILNNRTRARIRAGAGEVAEFIRFEPPTTRAQRRDLWATGASPYEDFRAMGTFHLSVVWVTQALLDDADSVVEIRSVTGHRIVSSPFWGSSLEYDPATGGIASITVADASGRLEKQEVLEYFPSGSPSAGQPLMIRLSFLWPGRHDQFQLSSIRVYTQFSKPGRITPADFEWGTYAESAIDLSTGERFDPQGLVIESGRTTAPNINAKTKPSGVLTTAEAAAIGKSPPPSRAGVKSRHRGLQVALFVGASLCFLGGFSVVLIKRLRG